MKTSKPKSGWLIPIWLTSGGEGVEMIHNSGAPGHSVHTEDIHSVWSPGGTCTPAVEMSMVKDTTIKQGPMNSMSKSWQHRD
jgi:hypothetical protein